MATFVGKPAFNLDAQTADHNLWGRGIESVSWCSAAVYCGSAYPSECHEGGDLRKTLCPGSMQKRMPSSLKTSNASTKRVVVVVATRGE
jgi:hypothetical protein